MSVGYELIARYNELMGAAPLPLVHDIADDSDYIEVDVEKVDVPPGKWRVITKHVPGNHLIIARYARISEINKANRNPINFTSARQASDEKDEQDFQWGSTKDRVRPGLNIFDEKGRELEWDYEHDTRFYEDPNIANDAADKKVEKSSTSETTQSEETLKVGDRVIHSRGRGAKKFVLKSSSSEEDSD
uniref:Hypervirulence associated protein TUDOR domain-containing protein n=1 Tax=Acrobeloides nanus TaxID=290746 RepID=A0A914CVW4_9BILA